MAMCSVLAGGVAPVWLPDATAQDAVPALTAQVAPAYPPIAANARIQGDVVLEAAIAGDGAVTDVRVVRSLPFLVDAAVLAVRQWRFAPGGGPRVVPVVVHFELTDVVFAPAAAPPAGRRPSVPDDFAFQLVVNCDAGSEHIDSSRGVASTLPRQPGRESRRFALAAADEERVYRALEAANLTFVRRVIPSDTLVVSPKGIDVTVTGEVGVFEVLTTHSQPVRSRTQRLALRRAGDIAVATWEEPVNASDPWAQRLANVSRLIREVTFRSMTETGPPSGKGCL